LSLDWLHQRPTTHIRWGLERIEALLSSVGDPHRAFRALHVGGTNGKGSVSALLANALHASASDPVGLYTSPHLIDFSERIRIDGVPVSDHLLERSAERLRPAIEESGATYFEATTAIAFLCFAEVGVRIAAVEVGMGGRLDATNVVRPEVSVVTQVALDHTRHLGGTLPEIAREKGGIFKAGVPAITGETDPAVLEELAARAKAAGAPFFHVDQRVRIARSEPLPEGIMVEMETDTWGRLTVALPLRGGHQAGNAALAVGALSLLSDDLRPAREAIERGMESVRHPGRMQREVRGTTTWLFDIAHNPAGASALAVALGSERLPRPIVAVVGILGDKDWRGMLEPLLPACDGAILTTPPSMPEDRRWAPAEVAAALLPRFPARVIPDLEAALLRAETLAPHGTVLVTGSVHTVGDAFAVLGINPYPRESASGPPPAFGSRNSMTP
jgi:dihydrofolate synthase / folylpolyglutamate synthase